MDEWTITQLASRAAEELADLDVNGRVQDVPNARLIRWYTTLGLLDPPLRHGRTARYTRRHLLQLIAVKRRQAAGRSLAEIQAELLQAPDQRLSAITGPVPDIAWSGSSPRPERPEPGPSARRFWAAPPTTETSAAQGAQPSPVEAETAGGQGAQPSPVEFENAAFQGIRLAPGAMLLLEGGPLSADQVSALHGAAAPLLAELARLGLLPPEGVDTAPA
ncbi:MerR-like DNA binding protein [Actinocorallia herbida]|uniref:MerR-like DNA binding protein n=1 Tax=Actinocorallia herbida TaxID=58109 RepID=A0A3N1DA56_9ACTN|nr:MerR family transcriptional regulator [Actinocorallia herbida]ROO90389.1 MerR-like DNA binding protein [Actinocorallia herbida]